MIKKKSFKLRLFSAFICFLTILNSGGAVSASDVSLGDFNSTCANTTNISLLMALNESEKLVQQAHEKMPQKPFFNLTSEEIASIGSLGAWASFFLAEYVPIINIPDIIGSRHPNLFGHILYYGSSGHIVFGANTPLIPACSIYLTNHWLLDAAKNFTINQLTIPGLLTYLGSVALIASARVYDINRVRRDYAERHSEWFLHETLAGAASNFIDIGESRQREIYNHIFSELYQPYGFSSISPLHWGWMAYSAIGVNAAIWGVWGLGYQAFQMAAPFNR